MKSTICMRANIKVFYKVILILLMGMIQDFQSTQSNKFAMSLQYLKKEVRTGVHFFHADKHQSFYKLARRVQNTHNSKLVIFCNILRKKSRNCFCVLLSCKTFRYFTGSSHVRCYLLDSQFSLRLQVQFLFFIGIHRVKCYVIFFA